MSAVPVSLISDPALENTSLKISAEEFLAFEREAVDRHEWYRGLVTAMAGGTMPHSRISTNLVIAVNPAISRRGCSMFNSDMRIRAGRPEDPVYTYADLVLVCGAGGPIAMDGRKDVLLNPSAVFEVLSPSTEAHDRGRKFELYRQIPSLCHYVLVSQDRVLVEHFARPNDGENEVWTYKPLDRMQDELDLFCDPEAMVRVSDIYQGIAF